MGNLIKTRFKDIFFNKDEQYFLYDQQWKLVDESQSEASPSTETEIPDEAEKLISHISFKFYVKRQKFHETNKEQQIITVYDGLSGVLMGQITATVPTLTEDLLSLREYGVVIGRSDFISLKNCIEKYYNEILTEIIHEEQSISDEELKNILTMIGEYISERKSDGYDLKASVKGEICYNIPVKEFQDLIRDSEYAHINLMELKKQLKRQGYTICSTGRYDRTVHNSTMGKAEKVMSFSQKAITTLPELPETEVKE